MLSHFDFTPISNDNLDGVSVGVGASMSYAYAHTHTHPRWGIANE